MFVAISLLIAVTDRRGIDVYLTNKYRTYT